MQWIRCLPTIHFIRQNTGQLTTSKLLQTYGTFGNFNPATAGLKEIVMNLDDEHRQILYLLFFAGFSQAEVALNFPDDRHDDFRRIPGLFAKMDELIPYLVHEYGRKDIMLNAALTHANFADIPGLVAKAEEWGAQISFSAYSCLRTGDTSLCINEAEDLALLRAHVDYLEKYEPRTTVLSSDYILEQTYRFFAEGGMNGCQAGVRFLVVRPDGLINPCSMYPHLRYRTRREAVEGFSETRHSCDQCYVSIRASTERPSGKLIQENLETGIKLPGFSKAAE